jgi:hypothetical protein
MALSLEDLTTPMTRQEVEASIYAVLAQTGTSTTSWKSGAVARSLIVGFSVLFSAATVLIAEIAKSGFLELAEGDWLHIVGHYVFGVDFLDQTFGTGSATLSNSGGGVYGWDPGDLILLKTATGKTYRNTARVDLGSMQTGLVITISAIEAGSASNAAPGEIDALETPHLGVTVTNIGSVIGLDAESDPAYRTRCYEKQASLSPNGPKDSYSFICRNATRFDGTLIGVTRVWTSVNSTTGDVTIVAATPSGVVTGSLSDPATDLGALNFAIQTRCVPDGVTATLSTGTNAVIPVTYEVWIRASAALTNAQVSTLVAKKLAEFFPAQPIGGVVIPPASGKVYYAAVKAAIYAAHPDIVKVVVTAPSVDADTDIADGGIPTLGTIIVTAIHQVTAHD